MVTDIPGWAVALCLPPDGRRPAVGNYEGMSEHGRPVGRLIFSPDGGILAVGSAHADDQPGPVRLWRAPPRRLSGDQLGPIPGVSGLARSCIAAICVRMAASRSICLPPRVQLAAW